MKHRATYYERRAFLALSPFNYIAARTLSKLSPAVYAPGIGYVISDAKLARKIMHDEHFSINEAGGLGSLISDLWGDLPTLLSMDGPEHQRVKFALLENFKEVNLNKTLSHELSALTGNLQKDLEKGKEVDVADYIRLHTLRITSRLLGNKTVSDSQLRHVSNLVTNVMGCIKLTNQHFSKTNKAKALGYVKELKKVAKIYYENPNMEKDSLIIQLKKLGYSQEKTYGFIAMFLIAGTVTVSSSFPRLLALLIDTGSIDKLREDPSLLESTLNEGFRYITPGTTALYGVKKSFDMNGRHYKEGRRVIIAMYNILHDKNYTDHPFRFDIEREQNPDIQGLWFGTGPHFCMGSVLAKLEIKSLLTSLAELDGVLTIKQRRFRKVGVYPSYEVLTLQLRKPTT